MNHAPTATQNFNKILSRRTIQMLLATPLFGAVIITCTAMDSSSIQPMKMPQALEKVPEGKRSLFDVLKQEYKDYSNLSNKEPAKKPAVIISWFPAYEWDKDDPYSCDRPLITRALIKLILELEQTNAPASSSTKITIDDQGLLNEILSCYKSYLSSTIYPTAYSNNKPIFGPLQDALTCSQDIFGHHANAINANNYTQSETFEKEFEKYSIVWNFKYHMQGEYQYQKDHIKVINNSLAQMIYQLQTTVIEDTGNLPIIFSGTNLMRSLITHSMQDWYRRYVILEKQSQQTEIMANGTTLTWSVFPVIVPTQIQSLLPTPERVETSHRYLIEPLTLTLQKLVELDQEKAKEKKRKEANNQ